MLHFSYGVMGSSKSAMLLMQRYNHLQLGHYVVLIKPAIDTRMRAQSIPVSGFRRRLILSFIRSRACMNS